MGGEPDPRFRSYKVLSLEAIVRKEFAAARQVGRAAAIAKERVWNKLSLSFTIERLTEKL